VGRLGNTHGRELRTKFWWENLEEKKHKEGLDVDGKILNGSEKKLDGKVWIGFIWLRIQTSAGSCEHAHEPSDSIKCKKCLKWLKSWCNKK
jgi:hypothetical protein